MPIRSFSGSLLEQARGHPDLSRELHVTRGIGLEVGAHGAEEGRNRRRVVLGRPRPERPRLASSTLSIPVPPQAGQPVWNGKL